MIVCVCNAVSDREIKSAVTLGISSLTELKESLGVATCCGCCESCAREVLDEAVQTHKRTAVAA